MKIIFVCTGNTCRGPMAEGIMRKRAPEIQVSSRGIMVCQGTRTARHTVKLLKERIGITLDQYSRQIKDTDCRETDFILTMTQSQADFIRNLGNCSCVYTLTEFAGVDGDVPDPYGGSLADYQRTFDHLEILIGKVIQRLKDGDLPENSCRLLWEEELPDGRVGDDLTDDNTGGGPSPDDRGEDLPGETPEDS